MSFNTVCWDLGSERSSRYFNAWNIKRDISHPYVHTGEQACKMVTNNQLWKKQGCHSSGSWRAQEKQARALVSKGRHALTLGARVAVPLSLGAGCWSAQCFCSLPSPLSWPSHSLHVPRYSPRRQAFQWFLFVTVPTNSETRFFIPWEPSSTFVTSGANHTALTTTFYCVNRYENSCFSLDSYFSRSFTLSLFPHEVHGPWR